MQPYCGEQVEKTTQRFSNKLFKNTLLCLFLFTVSLTIRLLYQKESMAEQLISSDAAMYFAAAYNIYNFGIHSTEWPPFSRENPPPEKRTTLRPGYPLFLILFITYCQDLSQFVTQVAKFQAVLGAISVVLTFILARQFLSVAWAVIASVLTALSPHLIAVEHYILAESLYTLMTLVAALLVAYAWKKSSKTPLFASGVIFGLCNLIRGIALFMGPFVGLIFFFSHSCWKRASKKIIQKNILWLLIGFFLVFALHKTTLIYITSGHATETPNTPWQHFIMGTYIDSVNITEPHFVDTQLERMFADKLYAFEVLGNRFIDKPVGYLYWYLWGKFVSMWKWDNLYNDDVYIYPMTKRGFRTNTFLHLIHTSMRWLHWPIVLLGLSTPLVLILSWRANCLKANMTTILIPLFVVFYYVAVLWLLLPLPRYTIPTRPFIYILASSSIYLLISLLKNLRSH